MKYTYMLHGLDCANCGEKIERKILCLSGVDEANVNFLTTRLLVEGSSLPEDIDSSVTSIVHKYEPNVRVERIN